MKCPNCQHEANRRFCPNCGTDLQKAMQDAQEHQRPGGPDPNATALMSAADLAAYTARKEGAQDGNAGRPQPTPQQPYGQPPNGQSPPSNPYPQTSGPYTPPGQQASAPRGFPPPGDPPPYAAGGPYAGASGHGPGAQGPFPPGQSQYTQPQTPQSQVGQYAPLQGFPPPGPVAAAPTRRRRPLLRMLAGIVIALVVLAVIAVVVLMVFGKSDNGKVKFGASYKDNGNDYSIQNEKTSFGPSEKLAWVANLNDTVDPKSLTRTIARVKPDGTATTVLKVPVNVSSSGKVNRIATSLTVADLEGVGVNPPGTYRVTYLSGGKKEATGTFALTGTAVAGKIFFGTAMSDALVTGRASQSSFGSKDHFDYVAHFNQPAGAKKVAVRFFFISSDGSERQVDNGSVNDTVGDPTTWETKNELTVARIRDFGVTQPGIYILRYYRGSAPLAEGRFTIHT